MTQLLPFRNCRDLNYRTEFTSDYTSITKDGAQWVVGNTNWRLIGIDYVSVATYADNVAAHQLILSKVSLDQPASLQALMHS